MNTNGEKVNWLDIRWVRISQDHPYKIQYRYSHNALEVWKVLDLLPKRPGRPSNIGRITLVPLYTTARCLQESKLHDLKALLEFVPPIYHAFYNTLLEESAESNGSESAEEGDSE